jgi:type IV secretion system protein VirB4
MTPKWRVRPRIVSFSLERDTEIIIRALGGNFYLFERSVPTGINPLQRPVTPDRIAHWINLVNQCLLSDGLPLLPSDREVIAKAVHTVAAMEDPRMRWFSTIRQNLTRPGDSNNLYNRFGRWCRGGENGWVFDMAPDKLGDIATLKAVGFDYTGIMANAEVKTIIMMELLDILEGLIDGTPLIYHIAEAWLALADPIFAPFIKKGQKTIRKRNGLGIFDTQEVRDLFSNQNGTTMVEQSASHFILPNRAATEADYIDKLRLTRAEFGLVQEFGRSAPRNFLCKQAYGSVQCTYDLTGADDMLAVLSSTTENVQLLDEVRAEVGDNPDIWLPVFYQRVRDYRASNATKRKAA